MAGLSRQPRPTICKPELSRLGQYKPSGWGRVLTKLSNWLPMHRPMPRVSTGKSQTLSVNSSHDMHIDSSGFAPRLSER